MNPNDNPNDFPGWAGAALFGFIAALCTGIWMLFGFYQIEPGEQGIELVFSEVQPHGANPGLNWNWPYPVGWTIQEQTSELRQMQIGDGVMLTGDENIVIIDYKVLWKVQDIAAYRFNIESPERTIQDVANSAMREVIGQRNIDTVLTGDKATIQFDVRNAMQDILNDDYESGIFVSSVEMQLVDVPGQVRPAYRDVQDAKADQEKVQNQAQTYKNKVVPEAEANAQRVVEQAKGYASAVVAEARGSVDKFLAEYEEYKKAPKVTAVRMYYERMGKLAQSDNVDLVLMGQDVTSGAVPYLPLNKRGAAQ